MPAIMPFDVAPKSVVGGQFPCMSSENDSVLISVEGASIVDGLEDEATVAGDNG